MTQLQQMEEAIMEQVTHADHNRIRPHQAEYAVAAKFGVTTHTVREAVYDLVEQGELVFAYHDPCHYLEIPTAETHHAARPMRVINDSEGEPWICDANVDPSGDLEGQGCWRCGDLAFTRDD